VCERITEKQYLCVPTLPVFCVTKVKSVKDDMQRFFTKLIKSSF